jgi:drug/metabolite transporter (DMT)-like permease
MPFSWRPHVYLFFVALIYGANYSISKWIMDDSFIHPLAFIVFRASAALVLFAITGLFFREKVAWKDHKWLFLGGIFGVWINQTLFFYGLHLGSPVNASLLMMATPILVLIMAFIFLKEKISGRKVVGVILGCTGAVLLIISGNSLEASSGWLGDVMVFINATSYAVYLVLVKRLTHVYHPVTISKWVFFYGFLFSLPVGWSYALEVRWSTFTPDVWWSFIYVLIFTTFLAYLLNALALRKVSASLVSVYIYLQPLFAIGIAVLFYNADLSGGVLISGIVIFLGVWLVSYSGNHHRWRLSKHRRLRKV